MFSEIEEIKKQATKYNQLIQAAMAYALNDFRFWPWSPELWKPSDPINNLTKSKILIEMEIDRRKLLQIELESREKVT